MMADKMMLLAHKGLKGLDHEKAHVVNVKGCVANFTWSSQHGAFVAEVPRIVGEPLSRGKNTTFVEVERIEEKAAPEGDVDPDSKQSGQAGKKAAPEKEAPQGEADPGEKDAGKQGDGEKDPGEEDKKAGSKKDDGK